MTLKKQRKQGRGPMGDTHEMMLWEAGKAIEELQEFIECKGQGNQPLSQAIVGMLALRIYDTHTDEIRSFIAAGLAGDVVSSIEHLAENMSNVMRDSR